MAVVTMKRLHVLLLKRDEGALIGSLLRRGDVDLRRDQDWEKELRARLDATPTSESASDRRSSLLARQTELQRRSAELRTRIQTAETVLAVQRPLFKTRAALSRSELDSALTKETELLAAADALAANRRQRQSVEAEIAGLDLRTKLYEQWQSLSLPGLRTSGSGQFRYLSGWVREKAGVRPTQAEEFFRRISEDYEAAFAAEVLAERPEATVLFFAVRSALAEAFERRCRQLGLLALPENTDAPAEADSEDASRSLRPSYADTLQKLALRRSELEAEGRSLDEEAAELAAHSQDWKRLHDCYALKLAQIDGLLRLMEGEKLAVLSGHVAADHADELRRDLEATCACAVWLDDVAPDDEDVPVALRNNALVRPYEAILETFSLPNPVRDVDPTPVMAPFYALLFGAMLSDVGYSLILGALMLVLLYKFRVEGNFRKMCLVFLQGSVSGIIFGFLFGGFFGNAVTAASGETRRFPVLWFDPMNEPMKLLTVSIIIGAVHLFVGMAVKFYTVCRAGQPFAAFVQTFPWYFIIVGAALYGALHMPWAIYLVYAGAAIILLFSAGGQRNPIRRILSGLGALYGITGYLSDLLSYSRILALTLATSVIAMVVNILATMGGFGVGGIVLFVAIMPFGHLLNLALSGLSAYVHATRLQYVEFFGKFYEGGGKAFRPLEGHTYYFRLVPETVPDGAKRAA